MAEDVTYLDLLILRKIDAESSVERFGSQINTSFFETANLLGGIKIKGLIEITPAIGGQSPIALTGEGKDLLETAARRATEPMDTLDEALLKALGSGVRDLSGLSATINIRPLDLAFHLHKLRTGDFIDSDIRSGRVMLALTEKGFNQVGRELPIRPVAPASPPMGGMGLPAGGRINAPDPKTAAPPKVGAGAKTLDQEIWDILNFNKTPKPSQPHTVGASAGLADAPARKLERATPGTVPTKVTPGTAQPPAPGGRGAAAPGATDAPRMPLAGTNGAPRAAPEPGTGPAGMMAPGAGGPPKLDRQAMLVSKLAHYAREYLFYAIVALVAAGIVLFALSRIALPPAGGV